jgi:hypothetical protein
MSVNYGTTDENKKLLTAHEAFAKKDAEASKRFHALKKAGALDDNNVPVERHGNMSSSELKSAVYGGLDGKCPSDDPCMMSPTYRIYGCNADRDSC